MAYAITFAVYLASIFTVLSGATPLFVADAFQVAVNSKVTIQTSPLIDGPSWLPLHCKVIVDDSHIFDFIPLNAASTETIKKLVTLRKVPATVRIIKKNSESEDDGGDGDSTNLYVDRAIEFCQEYDQELHLLSNNCWSFAFDLLRYISRPEI